LLVFTGRIHLLLAVTLSACPAEPFADAGPDVPLIDAPVPCTVDVAPEAPLPDPPRHTPAWGFEPWISKDISDRADTFAFVEGFLSRDIPVGAVVLDSPWDTNYTTFTPRPSRYPDFPGMVAALHAMNVRVVLWTTQMTNRSSFDFELGGDTYEGPAANFAEGQACGFFVANGATFQWWKGRGSGVDFFDARARAWWHGAEDAVLDAGIDGWKLDFGESYLEAMDPILTDDGMVSIQRYSEAYYRDFLAYGVAVRGRDFVTMVRGWDRSYDRVTRFFARPEHAPLVWAGDNRRDWVGLDDALETMFRSAAAGYVAVGSDIGGYLDRDDLNLGMEVSFDGENFDRWVAVAAMTPFMQLHGRANLAPWTVPERVEETVAIYRYWAHLHHALVPFFYSLAEERHASPALDSITTPLGAESEWAGDYRFTLGDAFLVAPILAPGGLRDVALPADARWYDWWDEGGPAIDGGTTLIDYDASDRQHLPVFVREGAIVPANVGTDVNGLGSSASGRFLTVLGWPAATATTFSLHEDIEGDTDALCTITLTGGAMTSLTLSPARPSVIARLRRETAPSSVSADGTALTEAADQAALDAAASGWRYDASRRWLWIKTTAPVAELIAR
jgi:alpha-glucosidase (family GH31 glycosyl hydrolase)